MNKEGKWLRLGARYASRFQNAMNKVRQPKTGVLQDNQERVSQIESGHNQNGGQTESKVSRQIFTGQRVGRFLDNIRNPKNVEQPKQIDSGHKRQEVPRTPTQIDNRKHYRCTECRKNYQGELSHCPDCNTRIPDWVYAKRTGEKTDISLG